MTSTLEHIPIRHVSGNGGVPVQIQSQFLLHFRTLADIQVTKQPCDWKRRSQYCKAAHLWKGLVQV